MTTIATRLGIVLDTESLGLAPSSIVTQIAFLGFDLDDPESIVRDVNEFLPGEPQKELNRTWEWSTLMWWMSQPEDVRNTLKESDSNDMEELLALMRSIHSKLTALIANADYYELWVRRPQHDLPMLTSLFSACGLSTPWKHDTVNDMATLMNLAGVDVRDVDNTGLTKHSARGDSLFMIRCYTAAITKLRSNA